MRLVTLKNKLSKQPLKAIQYQGMDLILSYNDIMYLADMAKTTRQPYYAVPLDMKIGQQNKNGFTRIWFILKKKKKKEKPET